LEIQRYEHLKTASTLKYDGFYGYPYFNLQNTFKGYQYTYYLNISQENHITNN